MAARQAIDRQPTRACALRPAPCPGSAAHPVWHSGCLLPENCVALDLREKRACHPAPTTPGMPCHYFPPDLGVSRTVPFRGAGLPDGRNRGSRGARSRDTSRGNAFRLLQRARIRIASVRAWTERHAAGATTVLLLVFLPACNVPLSRLRHVATPLALRGVSPRLRLLVTPRLSLAH
jgi:hypothetical protein